MKVAAFTFTSGLGQKTDPPTWQLLSVTVLLTVITVTGAGVVVFSDTSTSMSSRSGELHRELWLLPILTKSPRTENFIAAILNGGGGGGGGISGDWLPTALTFIVSLMMLLVLFGNGGFPVFCRRGGAGGGGGI